MMILIILNKIRVRFALRNYLPILIFLLLPCWVYTQPTLEWEARYSSGEALAMALDRFGNIYVAGQGGTSSTNDFVTIKYNSAGQQQWVQTYNGPNNLQDAANAIAVDDSGNVYITGEIFMGYVGKNADWDCVTIKYNTNGQLQWVRIYNTLPNGGDAGMSISLDENANVYVAAIGFIIKYNSNGLQQWIVPFNAVSRKIVCKSGFVYVTGQGYSSGSYENYSTAKYNISGMLQWLKIYNGTGGSNDDPCSVAVDDTGNVFVGGSSVGIGTTWDFVTIKYNSAGSEQWVRRASYDSTFAQTMTGLVIDNFSNVYVGGNNTGDYLTIKYNSAGTQQWLNNYNSGYGDNNNSIALDKHNNVYVTGSSQFPPPIFRNVITIKYSSDGSQQWIANYNSSFSRTDFGKVVIIDSLLNVYVSGASSTLTTTDILLLKYSQTTGIQQINNIADKFELGQNYPNPFNSGTMIKFSIAERTNVKINVYDILGREITVLINEEVNKGIYRVRYDAQNLSSGVYFYKITADQFTAYKKFILIK